jgi:MFS family permease
MPKRCPVCNENFERESGFYYGAMMISHALTTVIAVIVHFTVFHFWGWEIAPHLIFLLTIIIGLFPVIFRLARAIWINLFVSYQGKKSE